MPDHTRVPDYSKVAAHLATQQAERVTLSIDDVETLLGEPLPLAARVLSGWWNGATKRKVQHGQVWRSVGWRFEHIDLYAETVTFVRDETESDT
jgi:hypothetical protein